MQPSSELIELLKQAVENGRVVVIPSGSAPPPPVAVRFGLTRVETQTLTALMANGAVSREQLHAAAASADRPLAKLTTLNVTVFNLRRKLAPFAIEIINIHGRGFRISDTDRERIRRLIAEQPKPDLFAGQVPRG
jgi:hypothetical protein